jgi:hypothetical protein
MSHFFYNYFSHLQIHIDKILIYIYFSWFANSFNQRMIIMKKMMLSLLGCVLNFQCFANSVSELDGRLYIAHSSVYVAPDAIYVNMDGNFIQVGGIAVDANGVYIQEYECSHLNEKRFFCLKCRKYHTASEGCQ